MTETAQQGEPTRPTRPILKFAGIEMLEHESINRRRKKTESGQSFDQPVPEDLIGLGLSGGGNRAATFALGALQALNAYGAIHRIDYLSTVSGGGYIGASMVAKMQKAKDFPFAETSDLKDSPAVSHIRDNSRYLFPDGFIDILRSIVIMARGLVVNLVLVLAVILPLAMLTILANPTAAHLQHSFAFDIWQLYFSGTPTGIFAEIQSRFFFTKALLVVYALFLTVWGIYRSAIESRIKQPHDGNKAEFLSRWAKIAGRMVLVLAISFVAELQTVFIEWIIAYFRATKGFDFQSVIKSILGLAGFSTVLGLFREKLTNVIAQAFDTKTPASMAKAFLARAVLYIGALVLPLVVYVAYLLISASGIEFNASCPSNGWWIEFWRFFGLSAKPACVLTPGLAPAFPMLLDFMKSHMLVLPIVFVMMVVAIATSRHYWMKGSPAKSGLEKRWDAKYDQNPAAAQRQIYVVIGGLLLVGWTAIATRWGLAHQSDYWLVLSNFFWLSLILAAIGLSFSENANALHGLYRDRLNAAFALGRTSDPAKTLTLAKLVMDFAPYLLVNVTLNAQRGNKFEGDKAKAVPARKRPAQTVVEQTRYTAGAEDISQSVREHRLDPAQRGRNADFFLFAKDYFGSESTGYARNEAGGQDSGVDLATAVAISGAAVSSNSGRLGLGILAPTLALLNLRLGYWMDNPMYVNAKPGGIKQTWSEVFRLYLLQEAFGLLRTNSKKVFLSDGGHIENIGLYQLLKRRCKLIIIIDAEADPALNFGALADAQRFARIDLGTRIDIKWQPIRDQSARRMKDLKVPQPESDHQRHFAIGEIYYDDKDDDSSKGILLYIKANMTGDEADYVTDYERRYPTFPHETTIDQLFSEEQMEAYRTLGFHSVSRALAEGKFDDTNTEALVKQARDLLGITRRELSKRKPLNIAPVTGGSGATGQSEIREPAAAGSEDRTGLTLWPWFRPPR